MKNIHSSSYSSRGHHSILVVGVPRVLWEESIPSEVSYPEEHNLLLEDHASSPILRLQMRPVRYKVRMYREPEPIDLEKLRPTFGRLRVLVDPSASSLSKRWKFFAPTPGENG